VKNFSPTHDIAILKICDGYCATSHLKLAPKQSTPGPLIDVIGYPGDGARDHLEPRKDLIVTHEKTFKGHVDDAKALLPPRELIVSRGTLYEKTDGAIKKGRQIREWQRRKQPFPLRTLHTPWNEWLLCHALWRGLR
jgi:hypothetical protein